MATRRERIRAEIRRRLAAQDQLLKIAVRGALRATPRIARAVAGAWRNRSGLFGLVQAAGGSVIEAAVLDLMIASFVLARLAAQAGAATQRQTGRAFAGPPENAVDFLRRRAELPPEEVERLREVYGNEAARITRRLTDHVEAKAQVAMQHAVAEGMHVREGAAFLGQAIADAGIASANPFLLETLFRTQNALAYSAGRWTADQDPAVQEILWGYEYWTVGDDRVRPNHTLLDGMRLSKEDPRWERLWPPNGFNCRCLLIEVWNSDAEAGSAVEPPSGPQTVQDPATGQQVEAVAQPDKGWEFNPGQALELPAAKAPTGAAVKASIRVR